jgi:hypothetical protein
LRRCEPLFQILIILHDRREPANSISCYEVRSRMHCHRRLRSKHSSYLHSILLCASVHGDTHIWTGHAPRPELSSSNFFHESNHLPFEHFCSSYLQEYVRTSRHLPQTRNVFHFYNACGCSTLAWRPRCHLLRTCPNSDYHNGRSPHPRQSLRHQSF